MVKNQIFDRKLLKNNLDRFSNQFINSNFLFSKINNDLLENIESFKQNFSDILLINALDGNLADGLSVLKKPDNLIQTNLSKKFNLLNGAKLKLLMDDEFLCFKENSFDLVVDNLNIQFINDVLLHLLQVKNILKKDGLFMGCFFGGVSLKELRDVFAKVEIDLFSGISARVIPFIDIKDSGALMQKSGFKNIICDSNIVEVSYSSIIKLMQDLRNMGLSNIMYGRSKKSLNRQIIFLMENLIKEHYSDGDGGFVCSFEVITITAFN